MKQFLQAGSIFLLMLLTATTVHSAIIFVDLDANGSNNGNSWANAFEDLQEALAVAGSNDEIWVAAGVYKPTSTSNWDISFEIPNGVELYGGFNGTEAIRSQRNWGLNSTVLSGAIGSSTDETDNSRRIVVVENAPLTVTIDGFNIRKSYNNDAASDDSPLFVNESLVVLKHCEIYDNVSLSACAIQGLYSMQSSQPDVLVDNCLIYPNICNGSAGEVIDCGSFEGQVEIQESTITKNIMTGAFGRIITGQQSTGLGAGAICLLYNSIIWDNTISQEFFSAESMIAQNNILQEDLPTIGVSGGLNIDVDNLVINPEFVDQSNNNFTLKLSSPAINAGNNFFNESSFDIAKNGRIFEGTVDLGCYENQIGGIIYVDVDAIGLNNGSSWVNAFDDLQDALAIATTGIDIWVAEGYYYPTSNNNRDISFIILDGVNLYGGFEGIETQRNQRDWDIHVTRLSGNIGNAAISTDNSKQVIDVLSANVNGAVIDGFTIRDGHDSGGSGAAIFCSSSILDITHCDVRNNTSNLGAAVQAVLSEVTIDNCLIKGNSILGAGGIINGFTQPNSFYIVECTIVENNMATGTGRIIGGTIGTPVELYNSILWDNENTTIGSGLNVAAANCIVEGGFIGTNILNVDPLFVAPPSNYGLEFISPAKNAGDNTFSLSSKDFYHQPRVFDDVVDMGCSENQDDGVIYVDIDATGLNLGTSWVDAFTDLHSALAIALPGNEIWVANGTYKPTTTTSRIIKFEVSEGVELYGGFGGFETERSQRDWGLFPTIISGAIGAAVDTDNSALLVRVDGDNVIIDGFDFRKSYNEGPTYGAAMIVFGSNFVMKHCSVHDNLGDNAPAINVQENGTTATFEECLFYDNEATDGEVFGVASTAMTFQFINCTITRNSAPGNYIFREIGGTHYIFQNSIVWNHDDPLFDATGILDAENCIIEDFDESLFNIANDVLSINPKFNSAPSNDFTLKVTSPARNAGDNNLSTSFKDLDSQERIFEDVVDMGSYENQTPSIYYVDVDATGLNNGTSWQDAYTDLHEALNNAIEGQQIWVAEGLYRTSQLNDRSQSFVLKNNVPVYGGFNGTETALDQRDWFSNVTDLSGNLGIQALTSDNAYHVIFADDEFGSFLMDGFSIIGGNANGALVHEDVGGAVLIEFSEGTFTMANCFVFNNYSEYTGGAVTTFATSVFQNTTFLNNESHIGGAINWTNGTTIENCLFVDNTANSGIVSHNTSGSLDMRGCTFEGNTVAWDFNGIVEGGNGTIANSIIWGNTLFDLDEKAVSIGTDVHHTILQDGELAPSDEGIEVFYEDPIFLNPAGFDYSLSGESVGANGGDNSIVTLSKDVVGNDRIIFGTVDMGAMEGTNPIPGIIYVDDSANGANDGSNWLDAYTDFQSALSAAAIGDEIWVAGGWYPTTITTNRDIRFEMKDSLQIYGGFAATETQRTQRDWAANKSQLTGEIGSEPNTDNAKRLLNFDDDQGVVVDGFVLRSAYDDPNNSASIGTAVFLISGSTTSIRHCEIYGNSGYSGSGAITSSNSVSTFDNCLIHDNLINSGGIFNFPNGSGQSNIYSCTIAGNHMIQTFARPLGGNSGSKFDLYNSIIWGNDNAQDFIGPDTDLTNCLVEGFILGVNDTLYTPVLDIDPQFVAPNTADPDYSLLPSSIAVNVGSNANSFLTYDLQYNLRVQNGLVDLGAFEQNTCSQLNDVCLGAVTLQVDSAPIMGSTKCATGGDSPANACAAVTGKSVWFKFVAPSSGEVNIHANYLLNVTANFNIRLALYSGTCNSFVYVNCINATGSGNDEILNAAGLEPGNTYYIRVDAPSSQEGVFMIDVEEVEPACPGDFDHNGVVNVSDLLIFTGAFTCTSACGEPDMDGNGSVNVADLLFFISQFGTSCSQNN